MKPTVLLWEVLPFLGGGQRIALKIADALRPGCECHFIVPERGPLTQALDDMRVPFSVLSTGHYTVRVKGHRDALQFALRSPGVLCRAVGEVRRRHAKLLYVNGATAFPWSALVGSVTGVPVIWHVHNWFADKKTVALFRFFGQLPAVRRIVFVSEFTRSQFPSLAGKSEVIYNGVETSGFTPDARNGFRAEAHIPDGAPVVGLIAALMHEKGQHTFLRSIPEVLRHISDARFLLIGGSWPGKESYTDEMHQLAAELNIADRVIFTGHRNDVPRILSEIDTTVLCSIEACPLVLLESCAAAVPVVGPDRGGAAELIRKGGVGELYAFDNPEALASAIVRALSSPTNRREPCRRFAADYSVVKFAERIRATISTCVPGTFAS